MLHYQASFMGAEGRGDRNTGGRDRGAETQEEKVNKNQGLLQDKG